MFSLQKLPTVGRAARVTKSINSLLKYRKARTARPTLQVTAKLNSHNAIT